MRYLTLVALIFALLVSCGLQFAPEAVSEAPTVVQVEPAKIMRIIPAPAPTATPTVEEVILEEPAEPIIEIDPRDAEYIAKTLYGEYRGPDKLQQAGVAWCIVNRCDAWGETVEAVVTAPNQFLGYRASNPVEPYLYDMAVDVLTRWEREKLGETDVGRVLPKDYMWFAANSDYTANIFRNAYKWPYDKWDWSLESPYEEAE